ncbi:CPCC family cysteine-rich protein [Pseudomonas panipatensis]|uniref:Cysteine-rich CPCC n=1 Tax=Pseudomonas panipatensis TaxID=428992 RepID=A0A1G8GG90_9PSED|nr:CPCC family cysteine-rich protein [Pseudomonas panipatensis]SDH93385.1 Cysteine-rich CPCC [Pseudomonas panipatensis]SMP43430.1 Cysteine-rich CPCC [Pseudomonas panipatensis]
MLYTCPCCGHFSFNDAPGSYEICPICFWEDDYTQLCFPDARGGANTVSLIEAQVNYVQWGACEKHLQAQVRPVTIEDELDPQWFPLWQRPVDYVPEREMRASDRSPGVEACYWLRSPRGERQR